RWAAKVRVPTGRRRARTNAATCRCSPWSACRNSYGAFTETPKRRRQDKEGGRNRAQFQYKPDVIFGIVNRKLKKIEFARRCSPPALFRHAPGGLLFALWIPRAKRQEHDHQGSCRDQYSTAMTSSPAR